jgi:serine/threonine protein kinase
VKVCTTCGAEWPDDTKFCPSDGSPLRVAEGTSLIGGVVASYHIIDKLGEGGMGAVYLGEHVKMGRKSAIKVLTQSLAQDTDAIARFNREAANAARINHANVCAIYDFGETPDGLIFLAMEFIEGEALTDLLQREGPLGPYRAASMIRQIGEALQAAHDLGIVHRDLKPDNIMITRGRDGSDVVKVVDFGIAKATGGEEGQKVTRTGLVVGTPEYMSPEQLSGDVLDGRSDIYSLALVFFRILTGRLPFEADNAQEMMVKRLTDEPFKLNEVLPGANFPARLQQVLDRGLQRMPGDRYATAEEFTRDVLEAVGGLQHTPLVDTEGATQQMDSGPAGPAVTERLKKTRISGSKPTVPMDQGKPGTKVTPETPLPLTRPHTQRDTRKRPVAVIAAASVVVVGIGAAATFLATRGGGQAESPTSLDDTSQVSAMAPETLTTATNPVVPPRPGVRDTTQGRPQAGPDSGSQNRQRESNVTQPAATVYDSAGVDDRLMTLLDNVDNPDTRPRAMTQAETIFGDANAPAYLRGFAAFVIANGHYANGSDQTACEWLDRALREDPTSTSYERSRSLWGCTP